MFKRKYQIIILSDDIQEYISQSIELGWDEESHAWSTGNLMAVFLESVGIKVRSEDEQL